MARDGLNAESFHGGRVRLYCGDALDVLAALPESSIDSVVTDPPYHLSAKANGSAGFMGKTWDGGDLAFRSETWAACLRLLKPGGHLVAFGGSRTFDLMAGAIRAAGFEVRDSILSLYDASPHWAALIESLSPAQQGALAAALGGSEPGLLAWLYGQGFPKSHDVAKAIDKVAGAEREVVGSRRCRDIRNGHGRGLGDGLHSAAREGPEYLDHLLTAPATPEAAEWDGWGTALKPAFEPIILARRPLAEPSVARQVLATSTGAVNVGGCRLPIVEGDPELGHDTPGGSRLGCTVYSAGRLSVDSNIPRRADSVRHHEEGRWPANVVTDGSDAVTGLFPETHPPGNTMPSKPYDSVNFGADRGFDLARNRTDSGSAARFFYTAKATAGDRLGSRHPTVKPVALMQWLVKLVTPPGGVVLDPFAGTGTTAEAALREGFAAILVERETEYQSDIRHRMQHVHANRKQRREEAKRRRGGAVNGHGPLFDDDVASCPLTASR